MATFEIEILYNIKRFEVYLHSTIINKKKREHVITVECDHPSLDINEVLMFVLKKLSWIFRERDSRFMEEASE